MRRYVVRLVAAVLLTAAAGLGLSAPAHAASCSSAHGVTVVVDFHELGGGAQAACDADGAGKTALTQLADVGHELTPVQRQPGFVCRVDGLPGPDADPCVNTPPADAYWSVWWSDGRSGKWVYSSAGVGSLQVPDGGYVALSWQGADGRAAPRVRPGAHATVPPTSPPTSHATPSPTHKPSPSPSVPTAVPLSSSASPTSSGSPGPSRSSASSHPSRHHPSAGAPATPGASRTDVVAGARAVGPPDTSAPASDSGLPGWLAPVLVGALFVAAGTVAVVRRKGAGGG